MHRPVILNKSDYKNHGRLALIFMLIGVVSHSLSPLLIELAEAGSAPFLSHGIRLLSGWSGAVIFFFIFYTRQIIDIEIWKSVFPRILTLPTLGIMIGYFDFILFSLATRYIDISIINILYGLWPFYVILFTKFLYRKHNRYSKMSILQWSYIAFGFLGLALSVLSANSEISIIYNIDFLIGVSLAFFSPMFCGLVVSCCMYWSNDFINITWSNPEHQKVNMELYFSVLAGVIAAIPVIVIFLIIGNNSYVNEKIELSNLFIVIFHGLLMGVVGRVFIRLGNILTTKLELNAINYLSPIIALVWLSILGFIDVPHKDWLFIGAIAVVSSNMLLNLDIQQKLRYKLLPCIVWVFCCAFYFSPLFIIPFYLKTFICGMFALIYILLHRIKNFKNLYYEKLKDKDLLEQTRGTEDDFMVHGTRRRVAGKLICVTITILNIVSFLVIYFIRII